MASNATSLEAVGLALCLVGCAHRTDARTRAAFEGSGERPTDEESSGDRDAAGDETNGKEPPTEYAKVGWERLDDMLRRSANMLAASPHEDVAARLARHWCAVAPEPGESEHGPVHVCHPRPALTLEGHAFTLELGAIGVIGLVARDLSASDSRALADRALAKTKRMCEHPFEMTARSKRTASSSTTEELHTCSTGQGSILAVGRIPVPDGSWQVSISIVGAT